MLCSCPEGGGGRGGWGGVVAGCIWVNLLHLDCLALRQLHVGAQCWFSRLNVSQNEILTGTSSKIPLPFCSFSKRRSRVCRNVTAFPLPRRLPFIKKTKTVCQAGLSAVHMVSLSALHTQSAPALLAASPSAFGCLLVALRAFPRARTRQKGSSPQGLLN